MAKRKNNTSDFRILKCNYRFLGVYKDILLKMYKIYKNIKIYMYSVLYEHAAAAKSLQSCPTLCDPRDSSPLGSPVPGIFQARTLEWFAISFSNA